MKSADLKNIMFWSFLAAGVLAAYLPGLGNGLVFDDALLENGSIFGVYGSLADLRVRMLSYGSFVWIQELLGDGWWKQRLVNIALHVCVVGALYALTARLLGHVKDERVGSEGASSIDRAIPGLRLGIVVFALNPVAVYAVGYLIQRSILMATLFSVISCYGFLRGLETRGKLWFLLAAVAYACAVLSKEHAVMAVAMWVPILVFVERPGWKAIISSAAVGFGLLVVAAAFLYSVYGEILGKVFDVASSAYLEQIDAVSPGAADSAYGLSVVNQMELFFHYGLFWFVPNILDMSIDMRVGFPTSFFGLKVVLGALGYVAMLVLASVLVLRRSDILGFAGLCLLFPLLLFFTEFSTVWIQDPFVLYRSYLWAIGLPGLVCALCLGLNERALFAAALVVGIIFAGLAIERMASMRDSYSAWNDAAQKIDLAASGNVVGRGRPFLNRGSFFLDKGLLDEAHRDFSRAIQLGERSGSVHFNLGMTLQAMDRHAEALSAFDYAIEQSRSHGSLRHPGLRYQRGESLYSMGRYSEAVDAFSAAIKIASAQSAEGDIAALRRMALLRRAESAVAARKFAIAQRDFSALIEDDPDDRRLLTGLGMSYIGLQDGKEALKIFETLLTMGDSHTFHYGRSMALMLLGEHQKATAAAMRALRMQPENPAYQQLLRHLQGAGS